MTTRPLLSRERWQRIEEVFDRASESTGEARTAYLDEACTGDDALRTEVVALLAAAERAPGSIRDAIAGEAADLAVELTTAWVGQRLGPYRIGDVIGEGGMGVVYRAERDDDAYRGVVAIKVLHQGLATTEAVARFRDERNILAALEHPGIVRLLDGGNTSGGIPYLVMEYVEGVPITRFARDHALTVRARIELFCRICAAVQHAHQHLVVHRDLKPTNILVDPSGSPKLLDFGIAKLLDPMALNAREARTRTGAAMLTPEYASPEQATGKPVSTATDVYSLGAVLYELLADRPPLELAGRGMLALRDICELDPALPSTVAPPGRARPLAGDLDNIVLKALRKDPAQRYASVQQLADDLRRHLDGLPVQARPATLGYRAGKLVRRHGGKLAVAAAVAMALGTATVYSLRQARRADESASREHRRFDDVRKLANALLVELDAKIRNLRGSTEARKWVVTHALEYLDRLASDGTGDWMLERELALAYMRIGDVQGNCLAPDLGQPKEALDSYAKARTILERLVASGHEDVETRAAEVLELYGRGFLETCAGDSRGARGHLQQATTADAALPPGRIDPDIQMRGCTALAWLANWAWDLDDALARATTCVDRAERWRAGRDQPALAAYWVGVTYEVRLLVRLRRGEPELATDDGHKGLAVLQELAHEHPEDARYVREAAIMGAQLGGVLGGFGDDVLWAPTLGDGAGAEAQLRAAIAIYDELVARDPSDDRMALEEVHMLGRLGMLMSGRDPAASLPVFERARGLLRSLTTGQRDAFYARELSWLPHCGMSVALARLGRREESLEEARLGLDVLSGGGDALLDDYRLTCKYLVAQARDALGDRVDAGALLDELVVELDRRVHDRAELLDVSGLDTAYALLARIRPERACEVRARAREAWRAWRGPPSAFVRTHTEALDAALAACR